jgi:hypothetical protein
MVPVFRLPYASAEVADHFLRPKANGNALGDRLTRARTLSPNGNDEKTRSQSIVDSVSTSGKNSLLLQMPFWGHCKELHPILDLPFTCAIKEGVTFEPNCSNSRK